MTGKRIAIFGLGRSGLAIGKAAFGIDAFPHVYDEKTLEALPKRDAYEEAIAAGIPVTLGWTGEVDANILVTNPAIPKTHPKLLAALAKGVEVISEIEFAYRISRAPIIAITGTNGKSTTTVMTYLALKACGIDAVLCGNIFGSGYPEMPLTDAAANSNPDQILVAEISSFQLEWVVDFRPISAGITNIWPDHLDRYTGFDEYAATKQRIFARQGEGDYSIQNVVPTYRPRHQRSGTAFQAVGLQGHPALGISGAMGKMPKETHAQDGHATVLTFGAAGQHARVEEMDLVILDQRVRLDSLPFSEPHNYLNAGMAGLLAYGALAGVARKRPDSIAAKLIRDAEMNAERGRNAKRSVYSGRNIETSTAALPPQIIEGLKSFRGLAHRMELVGTRDRIRVINNSMCTNPDAVIKSAMAVRDPAHLIIGGVNKGLEFAPLRHYLANHRHHAYLFGSDAETLQEMLGGTHPIFRTLEEAFAAAIEAARPGEAVMLAPGCASTDQFRDFRDRGDVFRNIAKEWLER